MVATWKEDLMHVNAKLSESIADPTHYSELFPELNAFGS